MNDLAHLSYSSISAYQSCARSWRFRYIDKIKTPASPALIFGTAIHQAVQAVVSGTTSAKIEDIWAEKWAGVQQQDVAWDGALPEQMANEGLRMLAHPGIMDVITGLHPLIENGQPAIEQRVELHIVSVPVPVIGFIDLITNDGIPHDFKTASRAWTQEQAQSEMQPLFYLAALGQMGYTLNPHRRFRHIIFVKTRTPQVQMFESTFAFAQYMFLVNTIQQVWRGIESGVFPPNPGSWKCSERYCDYWRLCRGRP